MLCLDLRFTEINQEKAMQRLANITVTKEQKEWLERRKQQYGDTFIASIRRLIQSQIDKENRAK